MTARHYPDVNPNPDFAALEQEILAFWKENNIFQTSVDARPAHTNGANNEFIFYDGPPFANGLPHYGHLLTGFVKDAFARYQTMLGRRVERRFGWDCHGLPAEMGSEKELGISGRAAITQFGIDKFNEHCRTSVMKYTAEWEDYVTRQARWVDFKNDYKTMDKNFMESVLWAFKQLYDKGLVYEAYRVMPYSWAAETPLSNFETKLDNSYREREDKAITVAFELNSPPQILSEALDTIYHPDNKSGEQVHAGNPFKKCNILAWTTTPWTLPSNLGLAVSEDIIYQAFHDGEAIYIASKSYIEKHGDDLKKAGYEILFPKCIRFGDAHKSDGSLLYVNGNHLKGITYKPLFPYFADHPNAFRILDGSSFVTDGDGTGIVHLAPGFGEEDQKCCERNGIELVVPVDGQGKYTDAIFDINDETGEYGIGGNKGTDSSPPLEGGQVLRQENRGGYKKLADRHYDTAGLQRAKELRKASTEAEQKLWSYLRGKQLDGFKFRQQHPIGQFIADFYCPAAKLVIELDGAQHNDPDGIAYDTERTAFLESLGFRVLRFWNNDVLQNVEGVGQKILEILHTPPGSSHEDPAPPQGGGEGTLRLRGLNVIADTRKHESEPYKDEQLKKFGLANLRIIRWLKDHGQLIKEEQIKHNYPHCWRTDQPLIYRAMPSWYVEVTKFRDRAVELNKQINWIPGHIRDGQMGHMLATAPDWSISRNRFWGTPIPVWRSKSGKIIVIGSIAELEELSGKKVVDLHRPYIDEITITRDGEIYTRVEDVFDCWFESGSMPFAQVHYPFENKEWFHDHFPADFITEYIGQTRGWFNTLIMLSTALFDKPPFKNCICHGVVLDEETGLKYSKRLKNYKDPMEVFDKYGSDALRWMMLASPVMRGNDIGVDPDGKFIRDVVRLAIKPIWNAYNFFTLYANADGVKAALVTPPNGGVRIPQQVRDDTNIMDRYIVAKCDRAVRQIKTALDAYDTPTACDAVMQFFEALNNWYIRRNKDRFWKEEQDADKQAAYDTLYTVLHLMTRAAAPLLPLTCEAIYRGLVGQESLPPGGGAGEANADPWGGNQYAVYGTKLAQTMRKKSTNAEVALWQYLSGKQMEGYKFRRQQPIGKYIVDFVCMDAHLVIELDGGQHGEQKEYDDARTAFLNAAGYRVLRFWNNDLQNMDGVVETIRNALLNAPPRNSSSSASLGISASPPGGSEVAPVSVHLAEYPSLQDAAPQDDELMAQMDWVRDVCNAALAIRNKVNIRVRQPLMSLKIITSSTMIQETLMNDNALWTVFGDIITSEVNVRMFEPIQAELDTVATPKLSINSAVLGKRLPEKMKQILPASKKGEWKQLDGVVEIAGEKLLPGEYTLQLEPKPEFKDRAQALSTNDALVILDTTITPELESEGIARDLVRMIQQARKDAGLQVSDRITLSLKGGAAIEAAVNTHREYIAQQTLAANITLGDGGGAHRFENMLDDAPVTIALTVAA